MAADIEIMEIGNRRICIKGIGELFYQEGFPIYMSIDILKEKGVEVSLLHIADELYKNGWQPKTILQKLRQELSNDEDYKLVEDFISIAGGGKKLPNGMVALYDEYGYEKQREMIFNYLWGSSSADSINGKNNKPFEWFNEQIKFNTND